MKKVIVFLCGAFSSIIVLGVIGYFMLKDNVTMGDTPDNEEKTEQYDSETVHFKTNIEELTAEEFLKWKQKINKPTIVNFWASWCKPCIEEIPALKKYAEQNNMDLVFISADRNNEKQKKILTKQMQRLKVASSFLIKESSGTDLMNKDAVKNFTKKTGLQFEGGIPFFVILNEKGEIVSEFLGFNKEEAYQNFFDQNIKRQLIRK
ncbi:TlpA family protein disulfide reductase [Myroides indicus]|uniref:Redoxin n=1 Tax=Myroides indicus TaxID=1323422 RepID=A0A4R7F1C4_9FLAO|nr:TlpA disulfide reductase family protein [Myroides indicus]TDS58208.1 redoxin [Myroides indicus]